MRLVSSAHNVKVLYLMLSRRVTPGEDAAAPRAAAGRQPRPGAEGGHQRGRDVVPLVHRQGELGLVHTQHTVVILTSDWSPSSPTAWTRSSDRTWSPAGAGWRPSTGGWRVQLETKAIRRVAKTSQSTITEKAPTKGRAARRQYGSMPI